MIEKNVNINKKSVKRLLEIDDTSKRVTIMDNRYYTRNGNFYPSVTSILQFMPKNKFFETWLKDVGHNADIIMRKAGDEGTQVHEAIENYLFSLLSHQHYFSCSPLLIWRYASAPSAPNKSTAPLSASKKNC